MTTDRPAAYLASLVRELCALPRETEWVEFKENDAEPQAIGGYISALANAAALVGKAFAYLVSAFLGRRPNGGTEMSRILDGHLMGRAVCGRVESHKYCIYKCLGRVVVLGGYLMEPVTGRLEA